MLVRDLPQFAGGVGQPGRLAPERCLRVGVKMVRAGLREFLQEGVEFDLLRKESGQAAFPAAGDAAATVGPFSAPLVAGRSPAGDGPFALRRLDAKH